MNFHSGSVRQTKLYLFVGVRLSSKGENAFEQELVEHKFRRFKASQPHSFGIGHSWLLWRFVAAYG